MVCLRSAYPALHLLRFFGGEVCWCFKVQHGLSSFLFILFFVFHLVKKRLIRYPSSGQFVDRFQFKDSIFQLTHYVQLGGISATQDRSRTFFVANGEKHHFCLQGIIRMCVQLMETKESLQKDQQSETLRQENAWGRSPIDKVGQDLICIDVNILALALVNTSDFQKSPVFLS